MRPLILPLALCALLAAACRPEEPAPAAATPSPGALPAEWRIPERFQGEWHADLADCGDGADETELVIGPETIEFHESTGKVMATSVSPNTPDGITVLAEMTGEGMVWRRAYNFNLSENDQRITQVEEGPGLTRRRCPA